MEPRINFTKEWGRGSLGVGVWSTKEEIWLVLLFFGLKWVYWAVKPDMRTNEKKTHNKVPHIFNDI